MAVQVLARGRKSLSGSPLGSHFATTRTVTHTRLRPERLKMASDGKGDGAVEVEVGASPPSTSTTTGIKRPRTEEDPPAPHGGSTVPPPPSSTMTTTTATATSSSNNSNSNNNSTPQQAQPQQRPHARAHFPLSACALGPKPPDDMLFQLVRFLKLHLPTHLDPESVVEVEGKLGVLVDRGTGERIHLPVTSETLMDPEERGWYHFVADVGQEAWERCQARLDHRVHQEQGSAARGPYPPLARQEQRTLDSLYEHHGTMLRVTRAQTPEAPVLECLSKRTIAVLDIFNPASTLDMRVAVNVETRHPMPPPDLAHTLARAKARTSYVHELFRLDLTRTTTIPPVPKAGEAARPSAQSWEVEVEVVDARCLVQSPSMTAVVEPLLNNLRALSRLSAVSRAG
jgi:polynucleotide 5'-triphosphatase